MSNEPTQLVITVLSAKSLPKKEDIFYKLDYSFESQTKIGSTQKKTDKPTWNEQTTFKLDPAKKGTLKVEFWLVTLLKKRLLGEVSINIADLKAGETKATYSLQKKEKKNRGDIDLIIELKGKSKKGFGSIQDFVPLSVEPELFSSPREPAPNPWESIETAVPGTGRAVSHQTDIGTFTFESINCERGTLLFSFKVLEDSNNALAGTVVEVKLPREMKLESSLVKEYTQGPIVGLKIINESKLKLEPAFKVKYQVINDSEPPESPNALLIVKFEARAISLHHRNASNIKGFFKLKRHIIHDFICNDQIGAFEVVPDYPVNELVRACFKSNIELARKCLERGDDVNQTDEDLDTPLHKAVMCGTPELVKLLVEYGADPRLANKYSQKPIDIAEKYFKNNLIPIMRTYQ